MISWHGSIDQNGPGWQVGSVPATPLWQSDDMHRVREWLPATVPGNIESDLVAAGRIPNPYVAMQNEEGRWVENCDWWYRRNVAVPLPPGCRAHLVFHGLDYYSAVYVNNKCLGYHEGMFSGQVFDITSLAGHADGYLDVAVRVWGAHALPKQRLSLWQRLASAILRPIVGNTDLFPARIHTLKCQMSFGWDFAPRLPTAGIWDDVELVLSGPVFIADMWVRARPVGSDAEIHLGLGMDSAVAGPARLTVTVDGANFADTARTFTFPLDLAQGEQSQELTFHLPSPELWQPWDRGTPALYRLSVEIQPYGCNIPSAASTTFGVRSVDMTPQAGSKDADAWSLVVNGQKEFIRGVNWVPLDALPGRVQAQDYAEMINMARQANVNMLRVWGGGLREKRAFYDLCDRAGILVWQEFPLACPHLMSYPRHKHYLSLLDSEATSIVRALRNHPSLVLWCGGNEFSASRNRPIVERLARIVEQNDGTRPFRPTSPWTQESHNWQVWHHCAPLTDYRKETAPLVSEFGLQAVPDPASLRQFIPDNELWPPGPSWQYHNAELTKLWHYTRPAVPVPRSVGQHRAGEKYDSSAAPLSDRRSETADPLESFIEASQVAQARGIQVMVEHMRRRKNEAGGVILWQFNEPWPCISWSIVGYDRRPKLGYHTLQRVYRPLLVSVDYPIRRYRPGDIVKLTIWVINDGPLPVPTPRETTVGSIKSNGDCQPASLRLTLNGEEAYRQAVTIAANSRTMVGHVSLPLLGCNGPCPLHVEIRQGDAILAENDYDLSYYDPRAMPFLHALLTRLGRLLLR